MPDSGTRAYTSALAAYAETVVDEARFAALERRLLMLEDKVAILTGVVEKCVLPMRMM